MERFPTDETTLSMLIAACQLNPDTGRTHLMDFLAMGERVKSSTQIEFSDPPVFEVEHEEGYEPFSEHQVIETLAQELLAVRGRYRKKCEERDRMQENRDYWSERAQRAEAALDPTSRTAIVDDPA